jgi:Zn-finger nucleic acid-binding protein
MLACDACGGVWTDAPTARHIVTLVDREIVRLASAVAELAGDGPTPLPSPDARRCPICARPLAPVKAARVTIDVCPDHGTWFDRDEVGRLSRNVAYERASSPDPTTLPSGCDVLLGLLGDDEPD